MEDEYEDIRERVRVRGKKNEHERMEEKKSCQISRGSRANISTRKRDFFPFEDHLMQLHLKYFGYLKRVRNLSKGDISTYNIKEEDGAIAVMHSYLS